MGLLFLVRLCLEGLKIIYSLDLKFFCGIIRWIIDGKYPRDVENDAGLEVVFMEKFRVKLFSSRAMANPMIEISRAVTLRYQGIVSIGILVGGILSEMRKPAKMLPSANRLIGLIRSGLLSSMMISGE